MRILVVEDEPKLAAAVKQGLEANEHAVSIAPTGEDGFYLAQTQNFDVLIFDIMLPGETASKSWGICGVWGIERRSCCSPPKTRLKAGCRVSTRVRTITSASPSRSLNYRRAYARSAAVIRLSIGVLLKLEDLQLDCVRHIAIRGGKLLELTAREFELLEYLLSHVDRVVSREMLAREVWKEPARHTPIDNLIDVHIARLRRKMDDGWPKKLLQTVRGVGFVLRSEQ